MKLDRDRIAINPIQWMASADGWLDPTLAPPLEDRLKMIREAGIEAVHSEVPADMTVSAYAAALANSGLRPAPGFVSVRLSDDEAEQRAFRERAARTSEQNAALGMDTVFLSMGMSKDAPRVAHPAVGHDADPARLEQVRDLLAEIAGIIKAEGTTAALHPHVGSWAETDQETRFILDTVDAGLLKFGPDMGHLAWAGADPAQLVRDYAGRVTCCHIKDFDGAVAARGKQQDWDYRKTVLAGLWQEPGHGTADIEGFIEALGPDFGGWLILEVDRGAQETPEESVRLCGQWVADHC